MTMSRWLPKIYEKLWPGGKRDCRSTTAQRVVTARPCLEDLEDRVIPTTFNTTTNVAVSITPSFFARTATETITATVTQAGTTTPVTSGNVAFNVNGLTGTVALNSAGQASFTTALPLYAVAGNQSLQGFYAGATVGSDTFNSSVFLSPVYLNVLNALFPSNVTFVGPPLSQSSLPINPYGSYKGETDSVLLFFVPVDFHYIDPGTIQTFNLFGITFSGSLSAAVFAPYENFYNSLNIQLL
jgi:hypothetical protein